MCHSRNMNKSSKQDNMPELKPDDSDHSTMGKTEDKFTLPLMVFASPDRNNRFYGATNGNFTKN